MKVEVIGLGGAGCNIVSAISENINKNFPEISQNIDFYYVNTDKVSLDNIKSSGTKILLGERICKGLGCGADYNLGKKVMQEDLDKFEFVKNSDLVFIVSGFSKGTGSSAPILAKYLSENNILNLFFAIKPFKFEGEKKTQIANSLIKELSQFAHSFVIIENSKYQKGTFKETLENINNIISNSISIILKVILSPLLINIDYNDFKAVIYEGKRCIFAYAKADGVDRDKKIIEILTKEKMKRVKTCLLFIQGGEDMLIEEVENIANSVNNAISPQAFPIFGADIKEGKTHIETVLLGVSKEYEISE
ncbi:MAG: hypothetical protein ABIL45_03615 [candidate division WOR-3 bacterium]